MEEKRIKSFRDYFDYREEIKKIPPHRVLAINRGERAKVLRVKIETNLQAMVNAMEELLVPPNHPHADYLRGCARDSLSRLILSSLEREARRELTDRAEAHAVGVFAKNLRNLLLHPPVHNHRILALDPGYKSGCKLAALDQFGNLLEHAVILLIGKPELRENARQKVVELVKRHQLSVVVIGNGTACREAEKFISDVLGSELKEQGTAYVIVNEAGASVYSTSRLGREEFPDYDASLRGAISIGRRLQDPLSELVKIDPANIGVGLYQHDVKAKHLRTSLDDVVESCVNYVGVDVNTASPALLRYVSGLNQLTAHRLYEYRHEHGPFMNREQLRQVPGLGEATFVQAAGFLKIPAGDNPLDTTWIHPESYPVANRVLERLGCTPHDLADKTAAAALAERVTKVDLEAMAKELEAGTLSLKDILAQLARPGRDPREDLPAARFQTRRAKTRGFNGGHGIDRHGPQRGRFRLLCGYRHARQRSGARQPHGRPFHPRPSRGGHRRRRGQGLGSCRGQGAAAGVVDHGSAGHRASSAAAAQPQAGARRKTGKDSGGSRKRRWNEIASGETRGRDGSKGTKSR